MRIFSEGWHHRKTEEETKKKKKEEVQNEASEEGTLNIVINVAALVSNDSLT